MTLYTQVDSNIRRTWLLITLFCAIIIGLGWFFSYVLEEQIILVVAVIFSVGMSFTSYWYSDKIVLGLSRAKEVNLSEHKELYRVLENLCIAAGLPMPKFYIIEDSSPNAFATGRNPKHGVVVVTTGLLKILDRSELEGVLAHELSHIGNRDILLQTVVVVLVGFVALLSDFFLRSFMWGGRSRDREGGAAAILVVAGIVLAVLSPLAAKLIHLAISRKREFLADASGVLLTRYPDGLIGALRKISEYPAGVRTATNATAHLFICNPLKGKESKGFFAKMFMTHPPTEERIKALEKTKK